MNWRAVSALQWALLASCAVHAALLTVHFAAPTALNRAGDWAADNVITLPRPPRPRHQVAAVAPAGWRPANRQLAAGGGMMAASLLIGVWLGATGLTPPVGPVGPVGIAQQTTRPNAAEFSTVGELVQAVLPIELLEDDEDHL